MFAVFIAAGGTERPDGPTATASARMRRARKLQTPLVAMRVAVRDARDTRGPRKKGTRVRRPGSERLVRAFAASAGLGEMHRLVCVSRRPRRTTRRDEGNERKKPKNVSRRAQSKIHQTARFLLALPVCKKVANRATEKRINDSTYVGAEASARARRQQTMRRRTIRYGSFPRPRRARPRRRGIRCAAA